MRNPTLTPSLQVAAPRDSGMGTRYRTKEPVSHHVFQRLKATLTPFILKVNLGYQKGQTVTFSGEEKAFNIPSLQLSV